MPLDGRPPQPRGRGPLAPVKVTTSTQDTLIVSPPFFPIPSDSMSAVISQQAHCCCGLNRLFPSSLNSAVHCCLISKHLGYTEVNLMAGFI